MIKAGTRLDKTKPLGLGNKRRKLKEKEQRKLLTDLDTCRLKKSIHERIYRTKN